MTHPLLKAFGVVVAISLLVANAAHSSDLPKAIGEPVYKPATAELVRPRDGLGNVLTKLAAGEEVRIAYLGGSITAAPGWRVKTKEWFSREYPNANVTGIDAAIGGTGSDLGVFRLQHDALQQKPDLLFVEFAVNDGGASPARIWKAMEGIVRQTWAANPRTDICFVYTFRTGYEKDLGEGRCPQAASAMEALADHYGIPSINVALQVVERQKQGKLNYQSDKPTPEGILRFSQDGVHPLEEGHQLYTEVIADAVKSMARDTKPVDHASRLTQPFVADHWQAAKMEPIVPSMLEGEWKKLAPEEQLAKQFGPRMGLLWEANHPGSKIAFKFRGSMASLYDLLAPDGGQVIITVDGRPHAKPVPRFDSYCTYPRLATLSIAEGLDPNQVHTVTVEIHPDQPDRSPVAFRLKDPAVELKSPKYQGTHLRIGQILVLGDIVP